MTPASPRQRSLQGPPRPLVLGGRAPPRPERLLRPPHPELLGIGAGCHGLDPERLARFRRAITDPSSGAELAGIDRRLEAAGYRLDGAALKRPPAGSAEHGPAGRFLLHKALFVHRDEPADERVLTGEVLATCRRHWGALAPLHRWLTDNVQGI